MNNKLGLLANEGNPANKGLIVSAVIIFAGLLPVVEISSLRLSFGDSWLLMLFGLSFFMYFFSIKINQNENFDAEGRLWINTSSYRSKLSQESFNLFIVLFIIFIIRGGYLLLINIRS